MNHKKSIVFLLFLFFNITVALAQDFEDQHGYLDWKMIETDHFFVNFHPGAEKTAKIVAKIAEEIFPAITKLYNHVPDTKVSFIIKDYSDNSNGASYFFDNKIEIWASSMDFDLRGTHNWLRNVVTHEYTHMVQLQTAMKFGRRIPALYFQLMNYESERRPDVLYGFPNVLISYPIPGVIIPIWFAEGVAQYNNPNLLYDFWDSHRDMILRMYALDNNMLSWGDMGVFGKTSLGNESSYNAGFSIIQYISETYGFEKVKEISYYMSTVTRITIDGAIQKALGKSGEELYNEWKNNLQKDYENRISNVKRNLVEGEIIGKTGFANLHPVFSSDGEKIAYTSNKEADYSSLSAIFLYNLNTKKEEEVFAPVHSELSFSPNNKTILYSRYNAPNTRDELYYDIFCYDLEKKDETRLTFNLRAYSPAYSPDGTKIVFLSQKDGSTNLYTMDSDGKNIHRMTSFHDQEQLYGPRWSPDGKIITTAYSMKDGRDIALINSNGTDFRLIIDSPADERNPVFSVDGKFIVYSSDRTGIYNIYRYSMESGKIDQLTNVRGGAFMPAINKTGDLAFALYNSGGYKLSYLKNAQPLKLENNNYVKKEEVKKPLLMDNNINSAHLNIYNDSIVPNYETKNYQNIFGTMSFFPFVRLDNYNKNNSGIDIIKPGFYFMSSEVLEKLSVFGGASINRQLERDLFFILEYNDRIPGLYNIGLTPKLSLELYNISRKTSGFIKPTDYDIPVDVSYSMLEFDFSASQKIINSKYLLKFNYRFSSYSSIIGSFIYPEINQLINASSDTYLLGSDLGLDLNYKNIVPSRTSEINPIGRRVHFKYDYEMNRFNSDGNYEVVDGFLKPKYNNFYFSRVELKYTEGIPLPGWNHALSIELHGGSILGPQVNDFFDFYLGGFPGMKGYPFYGLGGNEFAKINVSYRFPISDDLDFRLLQIYFSKLYASAFYDYGNAWTGSTTLNDFKRDAGLELRLETFSWYAYPTRIFLSGAYGFDAFSKIFYPGTPNEKTVAYGKEWRFYLGVLFGFEIFDM